MRCPATPSTFSGGLAGPWARRRAPDRTTIRSCPPSARRAVSPAGRGSARGSPRSRARDPGRPQRAPVARVRPASRRVRRPPDRPAHARRRRVFRRERLPANDSTRWPVADHPTDPRWPRTPQTTALHDEGSPAWGSLAGAHSAAQIHAAGRCGRFGLEVYAVLRRRLLTHGDGQVGWPSGTSRRTPRPGACTCRANRT